ncbi:hypothetical protein [Candidatus Parabeggiatoa sp. HSG14]|uniref:hypothetical protein n=1 Tax=Candidatus Parabeggiatoa sp. HSG14 TaxID=3055593 RepID=UPI0025A8F3E5|nr:hypothetical protein [Thiotrichales bacterium HSG14]
MFGFNSSKTTRWHSVIVLLLAVVLINFASVRNANAAWCFFGCVNADVSGSIKFPSPSEFEKMGKSLAKGIQEQLEKTNFKGMGQKFGEGIRQEFDIAMDSLFKDKIAPLVADIDKLLKARIGQTDKMIEARLKQIDALIQNTFDRFQEAANNTIDKIKTDIVDNAFNQYSKAIEKTRKEIVDNTFKKIKKLRQNFRNDVDHFFDRSEYLINLVDCTEEKFRIDTENLTTKIADELEKRCPKMICGWSKASTKESTPKICYQELGLKKPPKSWEYSTLYDLNKCDVLRSLTPMETPVKRILNVYIDLQAFAARMACIQRASRQARLHYRWDWLEFGYQYDFWRGYHTY